MSIHPARRITRRIAREVLSEAGMIRAIYQAERRRRGKAQTRRRLVAR